MDNLRARARSVNWFTCGFDRTDHAISDDAMAAGLSVRTGRYAALCGSTVCAGSLVSPPGRRCTSCQAVVQQGNEESLPRKVRKVGVLPRLLGFGRPRTGVRRARPSTW